MLTLRDRLASIENKMAKASVSPLRAAEGLVDSDSGQTGEDGKRLAAGSRDLITDIKEAVKEELKKDEEAKRVEERKKQGEQTRKWIKNEYEGKMKKFPEFAQKIGLSGSLETDIRQIAEETFEKVMQVLREAWDKPEDEFDWMDVRKKIQEIEKDAETQIEPYVTEEQGKKLKKFFDFGR